MRAPRWRWGEPVAPLRALLHRGGVLAIPTESSYALAADPRSAAGVTAVFRAKGRGADKALPVVVGEAAQLVLLGIDPASPEVREVAAWWPAALTVALPTTRALPAAGGGATVAVRIPDHPRLCALLRRLGMALTATSANRSGEAPIVDPTALDAVLPEGAVVVDDGVLPGGLPSTLLVWSGDRWRVARPGRVPPEVLAPLLHPAVGPPAAAHQGER